MSLREKLKNMSDADIDTLSEKECEEFYQQVIQEFSPEQREFHKKLLTCIREIHAIGPKLLLHDAFDMGYSFMCFSLLIKELLKASENSEAISAGMVKLVNLILPDADQGKQLLHSIIILNELKKGDPKNG